MVHILPSLEMGGMERVVAEMVRRQVAREWSVAVLCTAREGALAPSVRDAGATVHQVSAVGARSWVHPIAVVRAIAAAAADVVHTHSGFWYRGALAAMQAKVPVRVHTVHGLLEQEPWWGPIEKHLAARRTTAVVAVSPPLAAYLQGPCRLLARQVSVVPNGVDVARFGARPDDSLRQRLGLSDQAFVVGTVARLAAVKHLDLMFGPLRALAEAGADPHFVIAGDGPERERLAALAVAAGVAPRVHFLGMVTDPAALLPAFDCYVLPSRAEGTSISLLEAMASRLPCIATQVGGNTEVLAGGGDAAGLLVPDDDEAALLHALQRLLHDRGLRSQLGATARARVEAVYSLEAMVDRYEQLYLGTTIGGSP